MPAVTLRARNDWLQMPRRCVVCGAASCRMRRVALYVPLSTIWGVFLEQRLYTTVPFCDQHRGHYSGQTWRRWATNVTTFTLAGLAILASLWQAWVVVACLFALLPVNLVLYLLTDTAAKRTLIHPTRITSEGLTVQNVHPDFAAAVEAGEGWEADPMEGDEAWTPEELKRLRGTGGSGTV